MFLIHHKATDICLQKQNIKLYSYCFFQDVQNVLLFLEANCIGTSAKRKVLVEILVKNGLITK